MFLFLFFEEIPLQRFFPSTWLLGTALRPVLVMEPGGESIDVDMLGLKDVVHSTPIVLVLEMCVCVCVCVCG